MYLIKLAIFRKCKGPLVMEIQKVTELCARLIKCDGIDFPNTFLKLCAQLLDKLVIVFTSAQAEPYLLLELSLLLLTDGPVPILALGVVPDICHLDSLHRKP